MPTASAPAPALDPGHEAAPGTDATADADAAAAAAPAAGADALLHWEDFAAGSVHEFGGQTLTREAIVDFARQFDPQPFHLDDDAARGSLFGGLCASGWHTCALTMRMMCDAYLVRSASLGSPGLDELRWTQPVYPGDTLHVRMTVLQARAMASRPQVGLLLQRWEVFNQRGQTVMTMQGWGMMRRRNAGAAQPRPAAPG
jgi:acyl dehydratase